MINSLTFDLRVLKADTRNSLQIFANRAGFIQDNGFLDTKDVYLQNEAIANIEDLINIRTTLIYSYHPVTIEATIGDSVSLTQFTNQTLWIISGKISGIKITNNSGEGSAVKIIRLAEQQIIEVPDLLPRQLITFTALNRIAQLPLAIVNLANVRVQSVTLANWTNDQVTNPGTGLTVIDKFRICNSNGTPNPTGQYIMILNDVVSQQNFSGTLQLWVEEIGS